MPVTDEHPICKFPARYLKLKKLLNINISKQLHKCVKLNEFINKANAQSADVVFSSYYLHSASSAFGHSLLKINRKGKTKEDLLGYAINYAALTGKENPFLFAFKGIGGFFKGDFRAIPYYYKVREYSSYESRDLWSYRLNFSDEEIKFLILHIWELGNASSPYYYATQNCSYWILRIIEAIRPQLDLTQKLSPLIVLPIETIKTLFTEKDLIKTYSVRSSLRNKVLSRMKNLNRSEVNDVKKITKKLYNSQELQSSPSAAVLDAAIDYYDFKYSKEMVNQEKELLKRKQPLMILRSQNNTPAQSLKHELHSPHKVHPARKLKASYGLRGKKTFIQISKKSLLHSLIDPDIGFDPFSEINFLDFGVKFFEKDLKKNQWELSFSHVDLLKISVLQPLSPINKKMAWSFATGLHDYIDKNYPETQLLQSLYLNISLGYSFKILQSSKSILYFMLENELEYGTNLAKKTLRLSMGPQLGALISWTQNLKTQMDFSYLANSTFQNSLDAYYKIKIKNQYYIPKIRSALGTESSINNQFQAHSLYAQYYF